MRINLPFPDKALWPNGGDRTHHKKIERLKRSHRQWGYLATLEVKPPCFKHNGAEIPVTIEVHAKKFGPLPDKDNCVAACKAMLDGIADGLGVNDRVFGTPQVVFAPERDGRFVVILGSAQSVDKSDTENLRGAAMAPQDSGSDASANSTSEPDPDRIGGAS